MGLGLALGQHLAQEQRLTLSTALKLKQELSLSLSHDIAALWERLPQPLTKIQHEVIEATIGTIKTPALQDAMRRMFSCDKFRTVLDTRYEALTMPGCAGRIESFLVTHLMSVTGGTFALADASNPQSSAKSTTVLPLHLEAALKDPAKAARDIEKLIEMGRVQGQGGKDVSGLTREISARQDALNVAQALKETLTERTILIDLALRTRDSEGRPMLLDFLREKALLSRYTSVASERLLNRFVERCDKFLKKGSAEFETSFLNTVGEYTLLSLGIIEPDIFALNKKVLRTDECEHAAQVFGSLGFNLPKIMDYYNMSGAGSVFFHRYAVIGRPRCDITDASIRDFLRTTVRRDRERVFEAAHYGELFEDLSKSEREHQGIHYRQVLVDLLERESFKDAFIGLVRDRWYRELSVFFRREAPS